MISASLVTPVSWGKRMRTSVSPRYYFTEHIQDAVAVNGAMRPRYRDLTQGRSEKIFRFLINAERLSLPLARILDQRTLSYQKKGLNLFQNEFLEMRLAEVKRGKRPVQSRVKIDHNKFWKDSKLFLKNDDLSGLKELCEVELNKLLVSPSYSILVRHLIESIYRCAHFLPVHVEKAEELGLKSPQKLLKDLILLQLWGLPGMGLLDDWCEPLQAEGVPLFAQELPDLLADLNFPYRVS